MDEPTPVVFLGPTLDHFKAAGLAEADFKPPAAMGDIMQATTAGASAIVLIDGIFESGPSVWHKEILFALKSGIPVIGASSMGALRAAELHGLGMLGFGEVFNDFAEGRLTDDDEVAVLHGPAETGWLQLSDAMVDIRSTAERATAAGIISAGEKQQLVALCKSTHFKDRNLLHAVAEIVPNRGEAQEWFQSNNFSQKRQDCLSLLEKLPALIDQALRQLHLASNFVPTLYMKRLGAFGYKSHRER